MSAIPKAIREGCHQREMGRCARCSSHGTDIHHRMRRREGGHSMENCILLCRTCHEWAHKHPAEARATGFIVSVWGAIESTPVKTWRGWMKHLADGFVEFDAAPLQ